METALCLRFIAHLAVLINGKPAHRMARAGVIAQCHWDYLFALFLFFVDLCGPASNISLFKFVHMASLTTFVHRESKSLNKSEPKALKI